MKLEEQRTTMKILGSGSLIVAVGMCNYSPNITHTKQVYIIMLDCKLQNTIYLQTCVRDTLKSIFTL